MSVANYIAEKYITLDDGLLHHGFTSDQIKLLPEITRARYTDWVTEANDLVESGLFKYADQLPLNKGTQAYTFAKTAALNWFTYKKRDFEGSKNASAAKDDFKLNMKLVIELLKFTPTLRQDPTHVTNTDSTSDIITPYSQSQGFPAGILW